MTDLTILALAEFDVNEYPSPVSALTHAAGRPNDAIIPSMDGCSET
jgi:hypothetical protein